MSFLSSEATALVDSGFQDELYTGLAFSVTCRSGDVVQVQGTVEQECGLVTSRTLFDLASLTKPFIALAVHRAVTLGVISFDTLISSCLPELELSSCGTCSIGDLLAHRSGLPASFDLFTNGEWKEGRHGVLRKFSSLELSSTGAEVYSCLGYVLLGFALERSFEIPLGECLCILLHDIIKPGELTFVPSPTWPYGIVRSCHSRLRRGSTPPGVVHDGTAFACGGVAGNAGLFASIDQMRRFGLYILDRLQLHDDAVMLMTGNGDHSARKHGFGFMKRLTDPEHFSTKLGENSFGHTGFTGSVLWIDPDLGISISVLTNRTLCDPDGVRVPSFFKWRKAILEALYDGAKSI